MRQLCCLKAGFRRSFLPRAITLYNSFLLCDRYHSGVFKLTQWQIMHKWFIKPCLSPPLHVFDCPLHICPQFVVHRLIRLFIFYCISCNNCIVLPAFNYNCCIVYFLQSSFPIWDQIKVQSNLTHCKLNWSSNTTATYKKGLAAEVLQG